MATFRPAVKREDSYTEKAVKYIPAEIVAAYTSISGFLVIKQGEAIPNSYPVYYLIIFFILLVITPLWTYYAVIPADAPPDDDKKKRALFSAVIATFAFILWVYALGSPLLKENLCKLCKGADCPCYSPVLGGALLLIFTVITPLIERIVFGAALPPGVKKIDEANDKNS